LASPELSVVICSRDGAATIGRTLVSLAAQTIAETIDVIVVDDGSRDDTAAVAAAHSARVIRHDRNRGLGAARNAGAWASETEIVAFIDDDCEATPGWAAALHAAFDDPEVTGAGGQVNPGPGDDFTRAYLRRHNPLEPLEMDLARSDGRLYRLGLYLGRQIAPRATQTAARDVFALVGASMAFRKSALERVGGFDEQFTFGAEELELCHRLRTSDPAVRLRFVPQAAVIHHFRPSLRDTLRRSRSYGVGSARLSQRWPALRPPVFPFPPLVAAIGAAALVRPRMAVVAAVAPAVLYPQGVVAAIRRRRVDSLLDGHVQLLQEIATSLGVVVGLRRTRELAPTSDATADVAATAARV
jgi:GT2 family glycosyltransferase